MITQPTSATGKQQIVVGFKLSPETIAHAAQLSQSVSGVEQQWSVYLRSLALFGFQQWLGNRARDLYFNSDRCSLWHPVYASLIDAACCLQVGEFSLCVIVTSHRDLPVAIPRAAIELPEFAAQFYVLVEVWEEEDWVRICGGVWWERLVRQIDTLGVPANPDWMYLLPADNFELEPDDLLLELRCLEPSAISQPIAKPARSIDSQLPTQLAELKRKLQGCDRQPWQILTWEEVKTLLCEPPAVAAESNPGDQFNRLLDWLKGVVSDRWSLPGTFPLAGIVFCGADSLHPQNVRRYIAQLYASQSMKRGSSPIVPPNLGDRDALVYLIQSVEDEEVRRQAIELLQQIEPEHPLLNATREQDLSWYFEGYSIALRVMFIPRLDDRYSVLLKLYVTGDQHFLPEGLQLIVLDEEGNELVTHTARDQDDWMERPLVVDVGDRFSTRIALNGSSVTEAFVV
jgi:hypothetical protein